MLQIISSISWHKRKKNCKQYPFPFPRISEAQFRPQRRIQTLLQIDSKYLNSSPQATTELWINYANAVNVHYSGVEPFSSLATCGSELGKCQQSTGYYIPKGWCDKCSLRPAIIYKCNLLSILAWVLCVINGPWNESKCEFAEPARHFATSTWGQLLYYEKSLNGRIYCSKFSTLFRPEQIFSPSSKPYFTGSGRGVVLKIISGNTYRGTRTH